MMGQEMMMEKPGSFWVVPAQGDHQEERADREQPTHGNGHIPVMDRFFGWWWWWWGYMLDIMENDRREGSEASQPEK
jgi:hypothetical protein